MLLGHVTLTPIAQWSGVGLGWSDWGGKRARRRKPCTLVTWYCTANDACQTWQYSVTAPGFSTGQVCGFYDGQIYAHVTLSDIGDGPTIKFDRNQQRIDSNIIFLGERSRKGAIL